MFRESSLLCLAGVSALSLSSCSITGNEEDYDTSDPYGVPSAGGYEADPYQQINPPASDPTYGSAAYETTTPAPTVPSPSTPAVSAPIASTHTIVKGDTLWGLSRKYNVTVDALRAANGMAPSDNNVRLGQTINIPAP